MSSCDKQVNVFERSAKSPPFFLVQYLNQGCAYSKNDIFGMNIFFFLFLKKEVPTEFTCITKKQAVACILIPRKTFLFLSQAQKNFFKKYI